jgi:hypothetical protein
MTYNLLHGQLDDMWLGDLFNGYVMHFNSSWNQTLYYAYTHVA